MGKTMIPVGILTLVVLASCGGSSAEGVRRNTTFEATPAGNPHPSATPSPDATLTAASEQAEEAPPPSPSQSTAVAQTPTNETSAVDFSWGSIGTIVSISSVGGIHIVEHPEDPTAGEQKVVSIAPTTLIYSLTATATEPQTVDDLVVGMRVIVAFDGDAADSYPGRARASAVVIIRTETEGPLVTSDAVTVTFTHSLFTLEPQMLPRDDAFILEYVIADESSRQIFFCGKDSPALETCKGDGAAYEVTVEVPRGAELHYAVYRLPRGSAEQPELVEQGREIVDMELFTRSHYRYGASNPGGYD